MENLRKKLKTVQGTTDASNQSSTDVDTVDKLQTLSSLDDDRSETTAVDEYHQHHHHHHHESLDVERFEYSASSKSQLNNSNENDLNEYCLLEIFSYLSIDDMMQVKSVCKMWYQVSQQWFKQLQTLEYNRDFVGPGRFELHRKCNKLIIYKGTETKNLMSILQTCGHHIKNYRAAFLSREANSIKEGGKFIFQWIPKLCTNIVEVGIYGVSTFHTPWNLEVMATHWKKLEVIRTEFFPQPIEENFFELLRNNKQLKTLRLAFEKDKYRKGLLSDKFFSYLPTTIKEVNIIIRNRTNNRIEQLSHFIIASKNFTSLQSLELSGFYYLSNAAVAAIADIKSLIHLSLYDVYHFESRRTIDTIANLKGLKSLCFSHNSDLYESNIINIVESCIQLEALLICSVKSLSNRGLAAIAKLEKLKYLDIDMSNVTIEPIIKLCDNLEVLGCYYSEMNDSDAIKLLKKGTNLRLVDFVYCRGLSKNILQAANEIANQRKNNILCITTYGSVFHAEHIDTPYFKYFGEERNEVPLRIFPNDIRNYIENSNRDNYF